MVSFALLNIVAWLFGAVIAAPTTMSFGSPDARLVKSSPGDPGQWVTDKEDNDLLKAVSRGPDDDDDDDGKAITVKYPAHAMHYKEASRLIEMAHVTEARKWLDLLTRFENRFYTADTGSYASRWWYSLTREMFSDQEDYLVWERVPHWFDQPSLIVRMLGETDDLVIVGTHIDSSGGGAGDAAPGADDNASGCVTLLESLRVLSDGGFKPKNTIEFHWYGGEEAGLLGSADIFRKYKALNKTVVAMLNENMMGFSMNKRLAIFEDNSYKPLVEYAKSLAKTYTGVNPDVSECGYACSDHASATANGFPAVFASEGPKGKMNPYIHTADDNKEQIVWDDILRAIHFTIGFLVEASYL